MINLEKNYRPVSFDDKDICTPEMWESIFNGFLDIDYVTNKHDSWVTYFFYGFQPYKAVMDKMRGNHIRVTRLDGIIGDDGNLLEVEALKSIFMNCNEDNWEDHLFATCQVFNEALQFSYFRKEI